MKVKFCITRSYGLQRSTIGLECNKHEPRGSKSSRFTCNNNPLLSEKCGEVFYKWSEFEKTFNIFLKNIKNENYKPRQFVQNELSAKPCSKDLLNYLQILKLNNIYINIYIKHIVMFNKFCSIILDC